MNDLGIVVLTLPLTLHVIFPRLHFCTPPPQFIKEDAPRFKHHTPSCPGLLHSLPTRLPASTAVLEQIPPPPPPYKTQVFQNPSQSIVSLCPLMAPYITWGKSPKPCDGCTQPASPALPYSELSPSPPCFNLCLLMVAPHQTRSCFMSLVLALLAAGDTLWRSSQVYFQTSFQCPLTATHPELSSRSGDFVWGGLITFQNRI